MKQFALSLLLMSSLAACKKEPGTGGLATITGKIYAYEYNNFGEVIDSGYTGEENVYISYGSNTAVDDNTDSNFDGAFSFYWLQKGNYTVWVYSECDTCLLGQQAVKQQVTITKRKETVTLTDFVIRKRQ